MFGASLFQREGLKAAPSLTSSSATQQLSQKFVRRPATASMKIMSDRRKKRARARGKDIVAASQSLKKTMLEGDFSARDLAMAQLSNTIFSKGHRHVATATNVTFVPYGNPAMPLVALAGRGKVGKTSLLRSLFRAAGEVGKSNRVLRRDGMNFFNVGSTFNVVDLPGFGGTSLPWTNVLQYASLLRNFYRCQPGLKMIYYCLDVNYKHGLYVQDIDMLQFMSREIPNFTIVLTKGDQIQEENKNNQSFRLSDIREELILNHVHHPVLVTSAFRMAGVDTMRFDMVMNCLHALPTDRLTYTEAKKLSDRILSQEELGVMKCLPALPRETDEQLIAWNKEAEESKVLPLAASDAATPCVSSNTSPTVHTAAERQRLLSRVQNRLTNSSFMNYVKETSPWRNPALWPDNVFPTKCSKANIMKCPGDPMNPYLFQAQFVASRADMVFRRPNTGFRKSSRKGQYEAHHPLKSLIKNYTIPYFPDIVDTSMRPSPWVFLGSKEAYYERSGGKELGLRLLHHALDGSLNPLDDQPAPLDQGLSEELKRLEQEKYSAIAMLTPPNPS